MKEVTQKNLKYIRRSLGYNLSEMARALGTPYSTYRKWERGERTISDHSLSVIRALLDKGELDTSKPPQENARNIPTRRLPLVGKPGAPGVQEVEEILALEGVEPKRKVALKYLVPTFTIERIWSGEYTPYNQYLERIEVDNDSS